MKISLYTFEIKESDRENETDEHKIIEAINETLITKLVEKKQTDKDNKIIETINETLITTLIEVGKRVLSIETTRKDINCTRWKEKFPCI